MKITDLSKGSHIHMIAIGGTGMRALALILFQMGFKLTGSDINTDRPAVTNLEDLGIKVFNGHSKEKLGNPPLVIRSAIIPDDNPEVVKANELGIPVILRTTAMAELANSKTIHAVAGSHGKSTATSMLTHILKKEGIKFSWYFGSEMRDETPEAHWDTESEWLILETDESDHGFLRYDEKNCVVLCIDPEHLEFYNFDLNELISEFKEFVSKSIKNSGVQILNIDDENTQKLAKECTGLLTFGKSESADLRAGITKHSTSQYRTKTETPVYFKGRLMGTLNLIVPGDHNVLDALSAIAGSAQFGVSIRNAISHLESYSGLKRRIEPIDVVSGHVIFDDDAGHPSELLAGIKTLKQYFPDKPLCIVHQPVRYSRVYYLADEYAKVIKENLGENDRYIASPASASDENKWGVNKHGISDAIVKARPSCKVSVVDSYQDIPETVLDGLKKDEVIFLSGHPPGQIRGSAFEIAKILKNSNT
ncbi:MAG: hypothetical protein KAH30_05365 [Caldisericia bacterium]|nr:hypothetical protein [Caldisericia bacterium]